MNLIELLVFYSGLFVIVFMGQWLFAGSVDLFVPFFIPWVICALIGFAPVFERMYRWILKDWPTKRK